MAGGQRMTSLKATNPQHAAFHKQAASFKPDDELPSNQYWIGIIWHHEQEPLTEQTQFLWVKAKPVSFSFLSFVSMGLTSSFSRSRQIN
jgi:hypothetical protein